jgi:ATP-dependent protease ClpP protease subunit
MLGKLISLGLLLSASSASCQTPESAKFRLVGPINSRSVEFVKKQTLRLPKASDRTDIQFLMGHSPGGDADALLDLVRLSDAHANSIFVSGECLSACAEFLFLSGKPITAHPAAKIGFHGNALTAQFVANSLGVQDSCLENRAAEFERILRRRGIDPNISRDQVVRHVLVMGPKPGESAVGKKCGQFNYSSKYRFWFPSSDQLRSVFGLKINGPVCADDVRCIADYASEKWGPRANVVVGDSPILASSAGR